MTHALSSSQQQRQALHHQIWQIANDVRGSVEGWDFKQYVLGTLFYRFMSENFCDYIQADNEIINYAKMTEKNIPDEAIAWAHKVAKGQ